jgi:hypothetical protein
MATFMWIMENGETADVLSQISEQPPRVGAIVMGAMLEERLRAVLETRFAADTKVTRSLFEFGPLGSFASKIDLCYLMKVYSKEAKDDLHAVRKIRNVCAHSKTVIDYSAQPIVDHCKRLTFPERYQQVREPFLKLFQEIDLKNPKHRFFRTCQIFNNLLIVAASNPHGLQVNKDHPTL